MHRVLEPATPGAEEGRILALDEHLVRDMNYPPSVPLSNPGWNPLEFPPIEEFDADLKAQI
eukprot:12902173-Prorocentrum_lima.AAC.1